MCQNRKFPGHVSRLAVFEVGRVEVKDPWHELLWPEVSRASSAREQKKSILESKVSNIVNWPSRKLLGLANTVSSIFEYRVARETLVFPKEFKNSFRKGFPFHGISVSGSLNRYMIRVIVES